ncbi:MAG: PucR family transcriptional regulator [Negativicutes bacterium]
MLKLKDLFHLPQLKDLKLAGGSAGLDRNLHWVHVVELPDVIHWTLGGELLFMTGIGIRDNLAVLSRIVEECARRNIAGLVINVGPYIPAIPAETIQLADQLGFPLFELPWEVKLVEVTKEICNHIMSQQVEEKSVQDIIENILYGDCSNPEVLSNRAALYDYDLSKPHRVLFIRYIRNLPTNATSMDTEQKVLDDKLKVQQLTHEAFRKSGKKILSTHRSDRMILLVPSDGSMQETQKVEAIAQSLLQQITEQMKNIQTHIGWGNPFENLHDGKKSMEQAELALKVAITSGKKHYFGYEALGFYKVLFNVSNRKELEAFRTEVLGPLYSYDQRHKGELLSTLSAFLEDTENQAFVADKLHIHRNTLRYRMQKVEELTRRNLGDTQDRMHLYFATVVDKYLSL